MFMKQKNSWGFIFWIALFVILLSFMQASRKKGNQEDIPYSTFKQSVKEGKIINVVVSPTMIEGEYTASDGKVKKFKTIPLDDPKLVEDMENNKVQQFAGKSQNGWYRPAFNELGSYYTVDSFLAVDDKRHAGRRKAGDGFRQE
jgi:cell division protease FtsH